MPRPIVAVADTVFPTFEPARQALARVNPELRFARSEAPEDILAVARDADGVLVTYAQLAAPLIGALERCKVISRFGIGVDNIDLPAARAKDICVTYVPDYCIMEVSDHTLALLLALARKIALSNALVQGGRWEMPATVPIARLAGRTLGLIGFGNIGRAVAPKAQAFGLRVVAHDPNVAPDQMRARDVEPASFDELLRQSDFISVHAPLTAETRGLVDAAAFARMKRGVTVVNTARGPLIDEAALVQALDSGQVGAAALDVVAQEPLPADSPLVGRSNVILSPHTAFYSEEALAELQTKCAADMARVLAGERPLYPVPE